MSDLRTIAAARRQMQTPVAPAVPLIEAAAASVEKTIVETAAPKTVLRTIAETRRAMVSPVIDEEKTKQLQEQLVESEVVAFGKTEKLDEAQTELLRRFIRNAQSRHWKS